MLALYEEGGAQVEMRFVQIRAEAYDRSAASTDSRRIAQLRIDLDQLNPGFDILSVTLADFFEERPGVQYLIVS